MIRLIILFAIFLAVYPMIGDGWAQLSADINLTAVTDFISEMMANLKQ